MKKISMALCTLMSMFIISCENLPDEQFEKRVVFTKNGFVDWEINYDETGLDTTNVSVSVSGTSVLGGDVTVDFVLNPDTLASYNLEKFRGKEELYYKILPNNCYKFLSENVTIKSGTEYALLPIEINMSNIDKYGNYVLPLRIDKVSSCSVGLPLYTTVMMNILLKNSFSGFYNVSGKLKDKSDNSELDMASFKKTLRVINDNTCYLYIGNVEETNVNRATYIVEVTFNNNGTLSYKALNSEAISFSCPEPNLDSDINTWERTISQNTAGGKDDLLTIKLNMQYTYKDITDPAVPIEREFKGALVMNTTTSKEK